MTPSSRRLIILIDSYPVSVSSEHVERKERRDPFTKPSKNPKPSKNEDHATITLLQVELKKGAPKPLVVILVVGEGSFG